MRNWVLFLAFCLAAPAPGETIVPHFVRAQESVPHDHPVTLYHPALPGISRYAKDGKFSRRLYFDTVGNWYERIVFQPQGGTRRFLLQRIVVQGQDIAGEYQPIAPDTAQELRAALVVWAGAK